MRYQATRISANFLQYCQWTHIFADNLPLFYQFVLFSSQVLITIYLILPSKGSKHTHELKSKSKSKSINPATQHPNSTHLNVMSSLKLQIGSNIKKALNQGILLLKIKVNCKMLSNNRKLRFRDLALGIVLEREFELSEAIEELRRQLVEEDRAVTIELRSHPYRRLLLEREQPERRRRLRRLLCRRRRRRR